MTEPISSDRNCRDITGLDVARECLERPRLRTFSRG